jgi:hypothetical protein
LDKSRSNEIFMNFKEKKRKEITTFRIFCSCSYKRD